MFNSSSNERLVLSLAGESNPIFPDMNKYCSESLASALLKIALELLRLVLTASESFPRGDHFRNA